MPGGHSINPSRTSCLSRPCVWPELGENFGGFEAVSSREGEASGLDSCFADMGLVPRGMTPEFVTKVNPNLIHDHSRNVINIH
jgi:hypothetical protein